MSDEEKSSGAGAEMRVIRKHVGCQGDVTSSCGEVVYYSSENSYICLHKRGSVSSITIIFLGLSLLVYILEGPHDR